ncbi:MAG: polysaccharide biosynthesis/export family protein [Flavobacteriales bacterium]|nr:polysaccharide biosynthesis/export family protein [Flavobacteriales bacterium]
MILNKLKKGLLLFGVTLLFACNYNSNVMLKTGKDYAYDAPPSNESSEYIISASDIIEFKLYTNNGSLLVDFTAIKEQSIAVNSSTSFRYLVEFDGQVKLPVIGRLELKGKTIKEVEALLEEKYEKFYIKPFVQVKVINKRVTVFPGGSSKAQIIPLTNNNMKLLEALGAVGGLTDIAKANKIKLIRGDLKNPKVYLFDLSKLEGIKQTDFVLQANDIIYIEPRTEYVKKIIRDVAPIVSLIASTLTLVLVITNLNKN